MTVEFQTALSSDTLQQRLKALRHVALDMDGTIYCGDTVLECSAPFLKQLEELGVGYSFVTNNPSKNSADYLAKLRKMQLPAEREHLYTSALATIDYLKANLPEVKRIFALGTPSMLHEFEAAGFQLTTDSAEDVPDAVIVGFDMTLAYDRVCRAAWWISQGLPYLATNPDYVCPTDLPTVLVDCGAMCAMFEQATGRQPDKTLGKPDPEMIAGITQRYGLQPREVAMVGDRLYTDIEMARRSGALGVLVLTGECTSEDAAQALPKPDLIVPSLAEFGALLSSVRQIS